MLQRRKHCNCYRDFYALPVARDFSSLHELLDYPQPSRYRKNITCNMEHVTCLLTTTTRSNRLDYLKPHGPRIKPKLEMLILTFRTFVHKKSPHFFLENQNHTSKAEPHANISFVIPTKFTTNYHLEP